MGYIKFTNRKKPVEAQAKKLDKHHIEIAGCAVNASGFLYYQDADMKRLYGDYSDFVTVYQELDESFILSNDGSVYPDPPQPEPTPEPTLEERVAAVEEEVVETQNGLMETYEGTLANATSIEECNNALIELYEMIIAE